jgi:YidC/Oxa1 family membrane protein insertase
MDRNSWIGMLMIVAVLFGWSYFSRPSEEQRKKYQAQQDSIALVEQQRLIGKQIVAEQNKSQAAIVDAESVNNDSLTNKQMSDQFGDFAPFAIGERKFYSIENQLMKIKFTNLGGRIYSVELKKYQSYDSTPVVLFSGDSTMFGLNFFAQNRSISTNQLFFTPSANINNPVINNDSLVVSFKLPFDDNRYMEYVYIIHPDNYIIDLKINLEGMNQLVSATSGYLSLNWQTYMTGFEKGRKWEDMNTTINYRFLDDDVEQLKATASTDQKTLNTKIKWISYKQQFFNISLIADQNFPNATVSLKKEVVNPKYMKQFVSEISLPYEGKSKESYGMKMFFGPNHYSTLKKLHVGLQDIIPLGRSVFRWVNVGVVIPVFNFLGRFISNYGVIILILTLLIKLVLFPLTYKSYMSTAKMKVLKPEVDKINEKFPKPEDAMKKQQATMAMYKKAGVSPMGGCLPMLLQMPLLIAMFRFFPASIELRHESFLWVKDLSTYDSILHLPFTIPYYGDHVSLFCLLMTIVNLVYIKTSDQTAQSGQQIPGMKVMMYMMPVMMLFWFNDYAAALSYYYFLSLLITIIQTYVIRMFVDDEAVLAKLKAAQANKKAPEKSKFQQRMEEMAKKKGYKLPK